MTRTYIIVCVCINHGPQEKKRAVTQFGNLWVKQLILTSSSVSLCSDKFSNFQQIKQEYENFISTCRGKIEAHDNLKCIAVVLMAHGGYGYIKCQTESLDPEPLELSFFFNLLESCSELNGIPKIFIIEACRQQTGMIYRIVK